MKPKSTLLRFLALAGSSLLAMSFASAQTIVNWDGDTSTAWATAGNWDTVPTSSLTAYIASFNLTTYGGNPLYAPNAGTTSIAGITIGALNGAMTLTTTNLSIGASGISIANGAGAFTISGSTTLGAAQSWTNNSASLFTFGAVTNGANLLTIGGSGNTIASGVIGNGAGGLTKEGAGLLTLNAANTYTGATTVNGGELRWGITNAIAGGALNVNNGGTVNMQTFNDTVGTITIAQGGSITGTTGVLTTGSGGFISNNGGTISGFSAGAGLRLGGGITYNSTGPGSTTLQIDRVFVPDLSPTFNIANGDAAIDFEITGTLSGGGNNIARNLTKTGAGVMQFSGSEANTTGINQMPLAIWDGTVIFNKSAEVSALPNSNITIGDGIGSAGSAILQYRTSNNQLATNPIAINRDGLFDLNGRSESLGGVTVNSTGQLQLNNGSLTVTSLTLNPSAGNTTSLSLGGSGTLTLGGDVTLNAAGTGQAQITGSSLSLGAANRIFTVGLGAGAGGDLLIDAQISASGARSLTKAGAGRLTLSNTNSYTGGTTVSAGTLLLSGAFNMPTTGTLTVSNGGTFSLADGTARATTGATTGSGLNLAAGSSLAFDWNGSSLDSFTTTGTATTVAGAVGIHINNTSPTGSGGTLITAASGLGTASYFLANNTNYTATISKTATTVSIGAQSSATALTNAYWLGGQVTGALGAMALSSGSTSNWASDAAGTLTAGVVPGGSAVNVIFGATGAAQQANVTTGADMNLGSITFNDSAAVTIGGGNAITLNSTSGTAATTSGALATVTAGSAISVTQYSSTTTNTNTISANLLLGANQTWNIATGKTLVVSGQVAGAATSLTIGGGGTLRIGAGAGTGSISPSIAIVNNASLVFNRNNAVTQGTDFAAGISGTGSVTHAGSSTLTLSGTNSYQGGTFINGTGNIAFTSDANFGDTSGGITFNSTGGLSYADLTVLNAGRTFTINSSAALSLGANLTVNGVFAGSGTLNLTSADSFYFTNPNNTFTGTINSATAGTTSYGLEMASIGDTAGAGLINLAGGSGTFRWISSSGTTTTLVNRQFALSSPGAVAASMTTISALGTTAASNLVINKDLLITGTAGARGLRFAGTNTGGNTFAGNIADGVGSVVTLVKEQAGTWFLSGTNSYTGGTTVTDGKLVMTKSASLGNSALTVAANKTFVYSPTAAGALNIGSGVLTLGSGTTTRIGTALGGTASQSAITSSGAASLSGTGFVDIYGISGVAPTAGVNNLITAASGLTAGTYSLGTVFNNSDFTVSGFTRAADKITVTVTAATPITTAYWKGGLTGNAGVWAASTGVTGGQSNWQTVASGGSNQPLTPGATADLIFSTSTSPGTMVGMTLGANMTVKTLTVNDTATAFGLLNDGYKLTITPGAATAGITLNAGLAASPTIGANIELGASQTWTNNSGRTLTVSGIVSGANNLTTAGANTITLTGANTYSGTTTVSAGTLIINGSTSSTSLVTVNSGATLGGTGTIGGSVTLNDGAFLSPGASIESLATGSNVWNGGSTFVFEFSTDGSTGAAGSQWDLLAINGTLSFGDASDTNRINFDLVTMLNATTAGSLGTWDPDADALWAGFVTTTGGITGFNSNLFTIDTTGFQNTLNGNFSIAQSGNNLNLVYTAVPEPRAALLGGLGLLVLLRRRR